LFDITHVAGPNAKEPDAELSITVLAQNTMMFMVALSNATFPRMTLPEKT
jgi:hypothetical protein